jgi:hypothetical protein
MNLINTYIEMMGDMEFAIYVACFVFGLILLIGLIAKLIQGNTIVVHKTEDRREPNAKKEESHQKESRDQEKSSQKEKLLEQKETLAPPAPPAPLEGVMMWEFDDGKKKKGKKGPSPLVTSGVKGPAPASEAPAPSEKAIVLPPPPLVSATVPEDKTVILPPKEVAGAQSALPASPGPSPVAAPPVVPVKKEEEAEVSQKSYVDFQMYETLLRRIAGLEADLKREPLYLDPLMKRIGSAEKKLEEMKSTPEKKEGGAIAASPSTSTEIKELTEKVLKLQKVLEQLSEGPSVDVSPKSSNYP